MQHRGDASCLPVVEQKPHVAVGGGGPVDEFGLIADRALLLVDRGDVLAHAFGTELEVTDRMIAEGFGVALPHLDGVRHELAHGRLEIIVADDATGDARGAGADHALVHDDNVFAGPSSALLEKLGEMVGGGEPVNPGTDDGEFGRARERHTSRPSLKRPDRRLPASNRTEEKITFPIDFPAALGHGPEPMYTNFIIYRPKVGPIFFGGHWTP